MANNAINLQASDCCAFNLGCNDKLKCNDGLRFFAENNLKFSVFNITKKQKSDDLLISYNYLDKKWYAGRYIGNVNFSFNKITYSINIKPRFGNSILLQMFEELFNIQFSTGNTSFKATENAYYLKLLVSFIWLQKLAQANRHGLPKIKCMVNNESYKKRGRLLVNKSICSLYRSGKIISERKEPVYDNVVIRILYQAYSILKKDYQLGLLKIPVNALEAIQNIDMQYFANQYVSQYEYQAIKYHPIYQNYKDIIDFSWQIIQTKTGYSNESDKSNISGFFLDMAEIWECYVRSIIKKRYLSDGWQVIESEFPIYQCRFYSRKIIPDIVLKKNDNYCVFDAKYKNMQYQRGLIDVDRGDFFQIHTYITYLLTKGNVLLGGLIYPSMQKNNDYIELAPTKLYDNLDSTTYFIVDGPVVTPNYIDTKRLFTNISEYMNNKYTTVE